MVKMKLPKGHGGFSVGNAQYKPDKDGVMEVEEQHVPNAHEHGAKLVDEEPKNLDAMTVVDLRQAYTDKFGEEPDKALKKVDLIEALSAEA